MGAFLVPSKSQKFSLFLIQKSLKLSAHIYNHINYKYLTNHNLLYNNQFGSRRNHSSSMALIQLVNNIASAMDNRESTAGVSLFRVSKAFDTIDHHILLNKLDH